MNFKIRIYLLSILLAAMFMPAATPASAQEVFKRKIQKANG